LPQLLSRWIRLVKPQDFVWLLFFGILLATAQLRDVFDIAPLVAVGAVQIVEPRIPALASTGARKRLAFPARWLEPGPTTG
jgi:hypothetical protein